MASALTGKATTGVVTNAGSGSPNRAAVHRPGDDADPAHELCCSALHRELHRLAPVGVPGGRVQRPAGAHKGCLTGPANADFDLYLERWNGSAWAWVARGIGQTSTETVTYNGSAGTYRWRVYSYSGAGAYTLEVTRP